MKNRATPLFAFIGLLVLLSGCTGAGLSLVTDHAGMTNEGDHATLTERQAAVAENGAAVMPFNLDTTTHIFEKSGEGGLQQVIADNPDDAEQITLIRAHLAEEATRFQQGDFHDPEMIHGQDMAGLHTLMTSAGQIDIVYSDLPDGAQILYTTTEVELIDAIHSWFDAQVTDHGQHATDQR